MRTIGLGDAKHIPFGKKECLWYNCGASRKFIPKDERRIHAKILSDAFVNDRLIGITGGDLNLTCDVKHVGRKPAAIDRIDWYVQYPNGIRREIKRTKLAESITTSPQGEWIYFDRLSVKPQGVNVFCVVRLEDIQKATQAYYSSPQVSLWLREPKLLVYIDGEDRPGIVSGAETQTLKIKLTSIQEEMSDNNERARPQPSPRDYPMLGAKALYDQMIIAGIRRQPNWIARFRCKGTDLKTGASEYSDYVKLEVLAGDTCKFFLTLRPLIKNRKKVSSLC
ncbi:unnamed protein product [Trichobilharzia regenti]|nr:unnamed protein product [Trichobilharzia regenti]